MRTISGIADLFQPLENTIREKFLPLLVNQHTINDEERAIYVLPTKFGGLNIFNPVDKCEDEYSASHSITEPLVVLIKEQNVRPSEDQMKAIEDEMKRRKKQLHSQKDILAKSKINYLKLKVPERVAQNL